MEEVKALMQEAMRKNFGVALKIGVKVFEGFGVL